MNLLLFFNVYVGLIVEVEEEEAKTTKLGLITFLTKASKWVVLILDIIMFIYLGYIICKIYV